jgi:hypothetical protein
MREYGECVKDGLQAYERERYPDVDQLMKYIYYEFISRHVVNCNIPNVERSTAQDWALTSHRSI